MLKQKKMEEQGVKGTFALLSWRQALMLMSLVETPEVRKGGDGFLSRLVQKAVDNIQVTVEKVHIRFEDGRTEVVWSA